MSVSLLIFSSHSIQSSWHQNLLSLSLSLSLSLDAWKWRREEQGRERGDLRGLRITLRLMIMLMSQVTGSQNLIPLMRRLGKEETMNQRLWSNDHSLPSFSVLLFSRHSNEFLPLLLSFLFFSCFLSFLLDLSFNSASSNRNQLIMKFFNWFMTSLSLSFSCPFFLSCFFSLSSFVFLPFALSFFLSTCNFSRLHPSSFQVTWSWLVSINSMPD